jgi:hypothetical protein
VARNPKTPIEILINLSKDENWSVRCNVASNPKTPIEILTNLSKDENWSVRCNVARNPKTPSSAILANLSLYKRDWSNRKKYVEIFEIYGDLLCN